MQYLCGFAGFFFFLIIESLNDLMRTPRDLVRGGASVKIKRQQERLSSPGSDPDPGQQSPRRDNPSFNGRSKKGDEMFISNERNDRALNSDYIIALAISGDKDGRYYLRALAKHDSITIMSGDAEKIAVGYAQLLRQLNKHHVVVDHPV